MLIVFLLSSLSFADNQKIYFDLTLKNDQHTIVTFINNYDYPLLCDFTFALGFQDEFYNYRKIKNIGFKNYLIESGDVRELLLKSFYYNSNSYDFKFLDIKLVEEAPKCHRNFDNLELIKGIQSALGNGHYKMAKEIYRKVTDKEKVKYLDLSLSDFNLNYEDDKMPIWEIISNFNLNHLDYNQTPFMKRHLITRSGQCELRKNKICGKIYFEKRSEICGVDQYREKESSSCGILSYKKKRAKRCGCESRNRDILDCFNGCDCNKYKACSHPSHGIDRYKRCRHKDHGIDYYKLCRSFKHGIEDIKSCHIKFDENAKPVRCKL